MWCRSVGEGLLQNRKRKFQSSMAMVSSEQFCKDIINCLVTIFITSIFSKLLKQLKKFNFNGFCSSLQSLLQNGEIVQGVLTLKTNITGSNLIPLACIILPEDQFYRDSTLINICGMIFKASHETLQQQDDLNVAFLKIICGILFENLILEVKL